MPVSQTAEYALRAIACLAQHNQAQTTQTLARFTKAPLSYLPKVLQPLTRAGIVSAQRGVRGGYRLEQDSRTLTVLDVVTCVDPTHRRNEHPAPELPMGRDLCPLHKLLDDVRASAERRFQETTIYHLAFDGDGNPLRCDDGVDSRGADLDASSAP